MNTQIKKLEHIRITIVTNITLAPYFDLYIRSFFGDKNVHVTNILYEEFFSSENQRLLIKSDYIIVMLNFDFLYPDIICANSNNQASYEDIFEDAKKRCIILYQTIKNNSEAHVLWFSFEDYYCELEFALGNIIHFDNIVERVNNYIYNLLGEKDCYINFKKIIANIGIVKAYDYSQKNRWGAPYSEALIKSVCGEIYKQHKIHTGTTKKCIILDCDNVLWGGCVLEDGLEGILLGTMGKGKMFQDFQRMLLCLYYHGVILAISSKNYEADILNVFRNHSGMILKEENISAFYANWDNKPENIKRLSKDLNIGLDSIIFIDDDIFEINGVKNLLPEVTTIQFVDNKQCCKELDCLNIKNIIDLDGINKRTATYRTNEQRKQLKVNCSSFEEYLDLLEINVTIRQSLSNELIRIVELSQRTNKCTNGKRYTLEKLKETMKKNGYCLYSVYVSDKFSDLGLVGAIGISNNTLELFCLSCRALGRDVEKEMLREVKKHNVSNAFLCNTNSNIEMINMLKKTICSSH